MAKKIRNMLNYQQGKGRIFTQKSQTIPEDGLSVRQILTSHTKGNSPAVQKTPEYHPEDSPFAGLEVQKMDLQDLQALSKHIANLRTNAENEIRKKSREQMQQKEFEKKVQLEKDAIEHYKKTAGKEAVKH